MKTTILNFLDLHFSQCFFYRSWSFEPSVGEQHRWTDNLPSTLSAETPLRSQMATSRAKSDIEEEEPRRQRAGNLEGRGQATSKKGTLDNCGARRPGFEKRSGHLFQNGRVSHTAAQLTLKLYGNANQWQTVGLRHNRPAWPHTWSTHDKVNRLLM